MNWNFEYFYKNRDEFLKDLQETKVLCDSFKAYQGKLSDEKMFVEYYKKQLELECKLGKVYQYASLNSDLNKKDVEKLNDVNTCQMMLYKLNQETAFENPEVLALGEEKVMDIVNKYPELNQFKFGFEKLFRMKKYILSEKEEKLLSICAPSMSMGRQLYSNLAVSDGVNEEATLQNGEKVLVTQGNWSSLIEDSKCQEDREVIFNALYRRYEKHKNTFAGIYQNVMEANKAKMQAKGFNSILESYLYPNNIPTSVYETLVKVASTDNSALKRYLKLKKEYLKLDEYHTYDRFLELAYSDKKYSYQEAKELFFKSVERFPQDFIDKAHSALEDGFVDVEEKDGKRTGAYSSSQTNMHPFILLNYTNTLDDVFTVAHEAGHSIHSMFSCENNPEMLQHYTIFVAEIASTFNEHNLLDYLMKSGTLSKEEKIKLIQKSIDSIMSTFYRQTLFADYELRVSRMVEQGMPLNYQVLSKVMIDLYKEYYDIDITKEKLKEYVWAYIPHLFYTPFYVYQYATSFAASFKIYEDINNGVPNAFEKYLGLLKAGGSKYPVDEAKDAGVDFTQEETFKAVTRRMEVLVNELEELLK